MGNVLVWFRNDLRVRDNEALWRACQTGNKVLPVYIFDTRFSGITSVGFERVGAFRIRFLLESLRDLKSSLLKLGGDLIIRHGRSEQVIEELVEKYTIKEVFCGKEVAHEEETIAARLEDRLIHKGVKLTQCWQQALYHEEDVPWPIRQVPNVFTTFRKESEKTVEVRAEFELPATIDLVNDIYTGEVPELEAFQVKKKRRHKNAVMDFKGGEKYAWKRLKEYFWEADGLQQYKNTRNGLIGKDYSSKLSPWLALGCISARSVYNEIKKYESERIKNASTYWLFFELLWRDFFKFMTKKHGAKIFLETGLTGAPPVVENGHEHFEQWKNGQTGEHFVDANMVELNETGFMSNRGRQIVASFLIHDLKVNWTWGAMWFENRLVDYDPCSNWLNWAYIAGVGNDPQKSRKFSIESQAIKYDPKGEYVQRWLKLQHS